MPRFTDDALRDIFTYHAPSTDDLVRYQAIREAAFKFAKVMVALTPESPDQTAALRKLRECVMTANAAVALGGKY